MVKIIDNDRLTGLKDGGTAGDLFLSLFTLVALPNQGTLIVTPGVVTPAGGRQVDLFLQQKAPETK